VEDALSGIQLPKAEVYGKQLFIVARTRRIVKARRSKYGQTAIFLAAISSSASGSARRAAHVACATSWRTRLPITWRGARLCRPRHLDFIVDGTSR
jgi:magnesium transporter